MYEHIVWERRENVVAVTLNRPRVLNALSRALNDTNDVKVAMTNASVFAYVADGRNGLRVLQLLSANSTPGTFGFSFVGW